MPCVAKFVRFHVLLSDLWASQCTSCWQVIAFSQNRSELSLAESVHGCLSNEPIITTPQDTGEEQAAAK